VLVRERIDVVLDPFDAALALRGDRAPMALVGDWYGGGAVLASEPVRTAEPDEDPFALIGSAPALGGPSDGGVGGGWFGWLGFSLARAVEDVPAGPPRPVVRPRFALGWYDHVLHLDAAGAWWWEALVTPEREDALTARRAALLARLRGPLVPGPFAAGPFAPVAPGWAGHRAAVAAARDRIHAGEIFQANLCVRLEASWAGDPLDAWACAGRALRPPRAAYVGDAGVGAVASLSPELFLTRRGRTVVTEPIKGTARAAGDLVDSAKDHAENVMIVDLMRNDLGRVAEYGSVTVDEVAGVRSFPGLAHLVSRVRGRLRANADDGDLLRATFPPGSVTGAPKVQALTVISELEATGREAYTGAVGGVSPADGLELNVAIRTLEFAEHRVWLGVGGGIVADSDPEAEAAECRVKAEPVVGALGSTIVGQDDTPLAAPPFHVRWADGRPDPSLGVFTTVAVAGGAPVALAAHLRRLRRSVHELYGAAMPDVVIPPLPEAGSVRIDAVPGGAAVAVTIVVRGPRPAAAPVLAPVVLPGGLGHHKWRDRRLIDRLALELGATPLFVDADGCVLETGVAAVLLREGDELIAPPPERGVLPSVALAGLAAPVRREPFDLARAAAADAVLVLNATRPAPSEAALRALVPARAGG
jgi:para-aminobenzoate synthetase/4-amino-4-deoxychorismate lyase